jgi:uncharacterized membrane protein YfcA
LDLNWSELAVICTALALGGLMKGVTGVGLPLIAVPVMAAFLGVERAVLVMVIPSLVLNLVQVITHRSSRDAVPEVPRILVGGVVGAAGGAVLLYLASEDALAIGLAVWLAAYVAFRVLHPTFALTLPTRMRVSPLVGVSAGAMQAATGISAPIIVPYMDALRLVPHAYVFAVCAPFGAFALAHCVLLAVGGIYTVELVSQSLLAVVPAVAFVPVGAWLRRLIPQVAFDWLVRVTLLVIAVQLVWSTLD